MDKRSGSQNKEPVSFGAFLNAEFQTALETFNTIMSTPMDIAERFCGGPIDVSRGLDQPRGSGINRGQISEVTGNHDHTSVFKTMHDLRQPAKSERQILNFLPNSNRFLAFSLTLATS